ncbi:MAG TPA: dihydrolipoyl dehydrogenase [Chloroflexota bacterium]|nr:dihydrolipoyl dehydrogenase [Chloroflexota bacterium]
MTDQHFNVVFIGGGSGGYVGAIRAAQLGMQVAVIEKDKLGGTCLHRGCIPSKAYLESAHIFHQLHELAEFGLKADNVGYDFGQINTYREKVVTANWNGVKYLMNKNKITVLEGAGTVVGRGQVQVTGGDGSKQTVSADNLVVAVGTAPRTLGIPVDGKRVFTSDNVWDAQEMPKSVIILGGGVIGVEFASFYSAFGVEVTVVEMMGSLIPMMDAEAGKELGRQFNKRGVKVLTNARALPDSVQSTENGVQLQVEINGQEETLHADQLLLAVAREAETTTRDLGLQNLGVQMDRGYVAVGENNRSSVADVYAVGDVAGGLMLAHKAYAEGILVAESIAGKNHLKSIDMNRVPQPVFSFPQVAAIGLTEQQARDSGADVEIGKFPFSANARAKIVNDAVGFAKVMADKKTGDILGVTLVGPNVTELISEAALGKFLESTPWELAYNIHPHPTLSEAIGEAAHAAEGEGALHI